MTDPILQPSFAAGELSPTLYARVDLEKYRSGAALLRNFFVDYRGGASNRGGTQFVDRCKNPSPGQPRLIPFIVSTTAAYALEFGDYYVRFVEGGAYVIDPFTLLPLEVASPYAVADLPLVKYTQSANVLSLDHHLYPPYELRRVSATSFTLTEAVIGPSIATPASSSATSRNETNNLALYGYQVTAVSANGEESTPTLPTFVQGEILNQNDGKVNIVFYNAVADAVFYKVYKVGPTPSGFGNIASPPSTVYGYIGQSTTNSFIDNNIAADFSQTPPIFSDPFSPGQIASITLGSAGAGYTWYTYALNFAGDGTGAAGYVLVDVGTGTVAGVVLTNPGRDYTFVTVTDVGPNTATYNVVLGQQGGTYPSAVGYFQQRRVHGGTDNFPEAMVFSKPGAYNNFDTSPISLPTDAITASIASRQVNYIKAFVPMATGLIVLTTGAGFLVSGGSPEAAITPESVSALPQASSGCNDMPPLVINFDVLYCQAKGSVVRDLAFNFYVQSYTGTDRSVLASHLFTNQTLTEWTYAEEPYRLVQVVRGDGQLLNFTYVPEQEIFAWTRSDTNGFFRSICSIPEGAINAVYVIVQRYVGGQWVYYIERFVSREFEIVEDCWFLDCALALPSVTPAAGISLSAVTGTITVTADAGVFAVGDVGSTLWAGTGHATVATYVSPTQITATVIKPFATITDNPDDMPIPYASGEWELLPNVSSVSGLSHLEGLYVSALADGLPLDNLFVQSGVVNLPNPASKVVVGLPYTSQLQTLRIDLGDPTVQGRRKVINNVTALVYQSSGLECGENLDELFPMKELIATYPPRLVSMEARSSIKGRWTKEGQIAFQQTLPLPVTILGIIPEVMVGDDAR
jgi:hypothetical protein